MASYGHRSAVLPNDYVPTALTTSAQDQATVLHVQLENIMLPALGGTGGAAADAAARAAAIAVAYEEATVFVDNGRMDKHNPYSVLVIVSHGTGGLDFAPLVISQGNTGRGGGNKHGLPQGGNADGVLLTALVAEYPWPLREALAVTAAYGVRVCTMRAAQNALRRPRQPVRLATGSFGSASVRRDVGAVGHLESQLVSKRSAPPRIRPYQGDLIGVIHPDDVALHAGADYARGPRVARHLRVRLTSPHVFGQDREPTKDVPPFLADGSPRAICTGNGVDDTTPGRRTGGAAGA